MKDINMLLNFVQCHPELATMKPYEAIKAKGHLDPKLDRVLGYLKSLLPNRLLRMDTGAPRMTALNMIEDAGWTVNPTRLTPTGWEGGIIQTRVGRILF